jgi:DTW domain-containing protein YfiP
MNPCEQCQKLPELCVCDQIQSQKTKLHVLILQHPQEPDHELGSARIANLALPNSTLKVGLSWRNLGAVLGKENADPKRWAVLYLGSGVKGEIKSPQPVLQFVSTKGSPAEKPSGLDGVIILDGTWSQAKALWWRNAWLLKCRRVILTPKHKSLYKELRREPRKECLSTIESIAEVLEALGEQKETGQHLRGLFAKLLDKSRAKSKQGKNPQTEKE